MLAWFKRRRIQKQFSAYVDPSLVQQVLTNPPRKLPPISGRFGFLLVEVSADPAILPASQLSQVIAAVREHGGLIDSMLGNLLLARFDGANSPKAESAAEACVVHSNPPVRAVWGITTARLGDHGGDGWAHYGMVFPSLLDAVGVLRALQPGSCARIDCNNGTTD